MLYGSRPCEGERGGIAEHGNGQSVPSEQDPKEKKKGKKEKKKKKCPKNLFLAIVLGVQVLGVWEFRFGYFQGISRARRGALSEIAVSASPACPTASTVQWPHGLSLAIPPTPHTPPHTLQARAGGSARGQRRGAVQVVAYGASAGVRGAAIDIFVAIRRERRDLDVQRVRTAAAPQQRPRQRVSVSARAPQIRDPPPKAVPLRAARTTGAWNRKTGNPREKNPLSTSTSLEYTLQSSVQPVITLQAPRL